MNSFQHVGVLGMRWGVRKRGPDSPDHTRTKEIKKKHLSELTNDDLTVAIKRMSLEKQYKDLSSAHLSSGQRIVSGILQRVGGQLINNFVKQKAGPGFAGYEAFANFVRDKAKKSG